VSAGPGSAVGGDHAITGTLPSLEDVTAFADGSARFAHGYYRFVQHPLVRRLEEDLAARYACRHCRLTESAQVALLELVLCVRRSGGGRVVVCAPRGSLPLAAGAGFLPAIEREELALVHAAGCAAAPLDLGARDILVVDPREEGAPALVERAAAAGATVIALLASAGDQFPPPTAPLPGVKFSVLGLGVGALQREGRARAGAVLGNADRIMDRLALQLKRRGPVLSSRMAKLILEPRTAVDGDADAAGAPRRVRDELCRLEGGTAAFLYCSGMSAITRVLDLLRTPSRPGILAVGHLYKDTFQTLLGGPGRFMGVQELDAASYARGGEGRGGEMAAVFTETITNPLGDVPDLDLLARVARENGVPLVVDNTLATPLNCRPLDHGADIVIHSTTKFLNGANDHAGGAVVVRDPGLARALADAQAALDDAMPPLEAAVLERRMGTLAQRMQRFNANAARVARFLDGHPGVGSVNYSGLPTHRGHATARRILRGHGSVISLVLARGTREALRAFYDSPLPGITKAPSLGSDVTLLCPYVLLAHSEETDEDLEAMGLHRFLVRIAVGCEQDISPVIAALDEALRAGLRVG
jgi:cystathionine beta-lyase/cystathionine gamma-synthase